jgi:hypothetical protein
MSNADAADGSWVLPLSEVIQAADFPLLNHVPAETDEDLQRFLDSIFCGVNSTSEKGNEVTINADLFFSKKLATIHPPGLEFFAMSIGADVDDPSPVEAQLVLGPNPAVRLNNLAVGIQFSPKILARVDDPSQGAELNLSGDVSVNSSGISFEEFKKVDLPESYLAGTKLKVSIDGLSVEPDRRSGG